MATKFSSTVVPDNSTDANYRAWATFIHDLFVTTAGWTNTSDTGQVDLTTVAKPTGFNEKKGYKIYAMADSLQGSAPCFVRVDFGSTNGAVNSPGIWLTIGTGSNGSGTITGIVYNGGAGTGATVTNNNNNTGAHNNYGSGSTNRVHLLLFVNSSSNGRVMGFSLERTKDSSGADTATGFILHIIRGGGVTGSTSPSTRSATYNWTGSNPTEETGFSFITSTNNPSAFSADIGIGLVMAIRGYARNPGYGMVVINSGDFSAEASFAMSVYGNSITYQTVNQAGALEMALPGTQTTVSNVRPGIRYD